MSDSEEENYCFFGKPLAPYDEDSFPKKKPIAIEDQIATDTQGRRRFHGAFTGGFSAGFFNTVGSLEGWTPSDFRSTRQEKAHGKTQKPEDFMDDEDIGEFGIAPQTVRATSDYSTSKKRKKQVFNEGPIPGEPVLHSLLTSGNETIGYLLLKNIGLKNKEDMEKEKSEDKVYGCEMPKNYEISRNEEINQYVIPDIYKEFLEKPKSNTFGLGYVGLDKSHINLFKSSNLVIKERNKKKISISGQAFGVGAFEDDDEDIYVKDDMSRYDFELTSEKTPKKSASNVEQAVFDDFILAKNILAPKEVFAPPTIPHSFTGKHKIKRSRFEPLPSETEPVPDRKDMNPEIRAKCLGEEPTLNPPKENIKIEPPPEKIEENLPSKETKNILFDRFVSASQPEDPSNILEVVQPSESTHGTQEMRDAARMKMFGPLTRIISDWHPCSLLCKRFNVPEPHFDELNSGKNRKRTKNLIFEYEKFSEISTDFKPGLSSKEETVESSSVTIENNNQSNSNIEEPSTSKEVVEIEEETPKDITEKIDVNKNIDLFKAVFLSSSESEDEPDEAETTNKSIEMKTSILSDSLLPKIKPIKEGILSGVDFPIFQNTNSEENVQKRTDDSVEETKLIQQNIEASYGPSLPEKLSKSIQYTSNVSMVQSDDDEWVEKKDKKNKNSHKKKHKNKKTSHKKKHKHRRD